MRSLIIRLLRVGLQTAHPCLPLFILLAGFISLFSTPSFAATVTYPQSFSTGWNLAGNSLTTPIDVKTAFGTQAGITTIWKWDAAGSKWAFYAPSLDTAGTLTSYATSKGYSLLTTINQGEGFWVNASAPVSLGTQSGTGFSLAAANLTTGWNLSATADDIVPATFTTNVGNVTTQWAWDNVNNAWYFYAPSLAANNTLTNYILSKGYKDFGTLTLGNGLGFWVNYGGVTAPVANAGTAQNVVAGSTVSLDGSASSDANGNTLTYAWTLTSKPAGSTALLSSATAVNPTFTTDLAGTYVATLVANDGKVSSAAATVTITAASISFGTLQGSWDAIANSQTFITDSTKLTVSVASGVLTVRAEQFFDGTCIYTANLTSSQDGVSKGTYQCSDFSSGYWQLLDMRRVDQNDIYISLNKNGTSIKKVYGMAALGQTAQQVLPTPISSDTGTYKGIATGGPFGTEPVSSAQVSVVGTTLNMTITRFYSGACQYSATLQPDGRSVSAGTFNCSDFTSGTWSLLDMHSIGGNDIYISLIAAGNLRRTYGIR